VLVSDRCAVDSVQLEEYYGIMTYTAEKFRMHALMPIVATTLRSCSGATRRGESLVVLDPSMCGHDDLYCFCMCDGNLLRSLVKRFVVPAIKSRELIDLTSPLWEDARRIARYFGDTYVRALQPMTGAQVVRRVASRQRRIYEQAFARSGGVYKRFWSYVQPFVKKEKYPFLSKQDRDPRPIQPRHVFYRAELACFMKPIDHSMLEWVLPGCKYPFAAKGMSQAKLAQRFVDMSELFPDMVAFSIDARKFDGSQNTELKKLENLIFSRMSDNPSFRAMLKVQEEEVSTTLFGRHGSRVKQGMLSGRCSGDPQTSSGNSVNAAIAVRCVFDFRIEVYGNGDDVVVLMDRSNMDRARKALVHFGVFGLTIEEEESANCIEDVFWCQSRLLLTPTGWTWVRDWRRVLDTLFANPEYTHKNWRALLKGIAHCEAVLNPGMPIVSPICRHISNIPVRKRMKSRHTIDVVARYRAHETETPLVWVVTPAMRTWFEEKFGISPKDQVLIEARMAFKLCSLDLKSGVKATEWINSVHPCAVWGDTDLV
jgi:hypothetical protein